ncbi:MAG: ABC transporter permease [Actinobacteria bacterium]|nr:MAG: ABC transporter permease [Actinomycetota bacterium]
MTSGAPVAVQPLPRGGLGRLVGRRLTNWTPAVVVLVATLAIWQEAIDLFHIKKFLLPQPWTIATTFWDERRELLSAGWLTFQEAFGGFAIGCGVAILVALALARWRRVGEALMPYAIAANAVPIIAFAPIADAWFSPFSKSSKMAIAAVLCFFPVLVNTLRGLTSVRPESLELMHSYAASQIEIFRRVRVPTALPFVFTALKIATVLSMIGAIVAQYFGGSFNDLGVLINSRSQTFAYKEAWAGIFVACLYGIAFYIAVAFVERLALRWQPSTSD